MGDRGQAVVKNGDAAAFSIDTGEGERVVVAVLARVSGEQGRSDLARDVAGAVREAIAVDCDVALCRRPWPADHLVRQAVARPDQGQLPRRPLRAQARGGLTARHGQAVAVTGATGFVGTHLLAALARRGWRLRLLVRRWSPLPSLAGVDADLVLGDVSSEPALRHWSPAQMRSSMPPG